MLSRRALEVGHRRLLAACRGNALQQLPFGDFLYGDLSLIVGGSRSVSHRRDDTRFRARGCARLPRVAARPPASCWLAFLLALGFASGLSLSGHSAADAGASWKSELADWVHLSAACLWLGGLVQLAFVVWPLAPALRREAFLRYARLAPVLIAAARHGRDLPQRVAAPDSPDLWTQSYGHVLLVKLTLVSVALAWGGMPSHGCAAARRSARPSAIVAKLSRSLRRRGDDRDGGPARRALCLWTPSLRHLTFCLLRPAQAVTVSR